MMGMMDSTGGKWTLILIADCDGILWWWISFRYNATQAENGQLSTIRASITVISAVYISAVHG